MRHVRLGQRRQCGNKPECFLDFAFLQLVVLVYVLAGQRPLSQSWLLCSLVKLINLYNFQNCKIVKCRAGSTFQVAVGSV